MYSLENKVAIITGGAKGIGAEIVKAFLKEGVKYIAVLDINESLGSALENELGLQYGHKKITFFNIDVTDDGRMSEVFHTIVKQFGAIDVIVNNAAIASDEPKFFKKEIEINFIALVASTLKGLELMRTDQGGKGGTIINISSIAAIALFSPSVFVYGATKCAVLHFSNCIGMEEYFRFTNVRVLTVCYGATDTDMLQEVKGIDDITTTNINKMTQEFVDRKAYQSPVFAAQGVVQSFNTGSTGSTWLVESNKIRDITADVKEGYKVMSKSMTS